MRWNRTLAALAVLAGGLALEPSAVSGSPQPLTGSSRAQEPAPQASVTRNPPPQARRGPTTVSLPEDFYYYGGQPVYLERSTTELVVRFGPGLAAARQELVEGLSAGATVKPDIRAEGRSFQVVTIPLAENGPGDLTRSADRLRMDASVEFVAPVFHYPGTGKQLLPTDEIVVKLKTGGTRQELADLAGSLGLSILKPMWGTQDEYVLRLDQPKSADPLERSRQLHETGLFEWAEPNFIQEIELSAVPDDPRFGQQWHLSNTGQGGGRTGADVKAVAAWDLQPGSAAITIAVIDSGVEKTHEDLAANIFVNPGEIAGNGIDDDGNGYVDDVSGWDFDSNDNDASPTTSADNHGTAVAGVAAGRGNNGVGISGACQNCRILPVKIPSRVGLDTTLAFAIRYAASLADILNNSWRVGAPDSVVQSAIESAVTTGRGGKGLPVLAAAGNGASGSTIHHLPSVPAGTHRFRWEYAENTSDILGTAWLAWVRFPDGTLADFESGALPAGWTTGGSSSWSVVADAPHSDEGACFIHAAKAGPVSGGQATFLETVRTVTEGDLYFHLWVEYQSPSEYGVRLIIDYNNDGTDDYTGPLMSSDPKSGVSGVPYPAAYPESIAVGATSNLDCRSHYSQFGPELDVVAPSNAGFLNPGIETTDRTGAAGYDPGNYTLAAGSSGFGGTSSATSLAAGIVGLLLSRNPSLTVAEVRQALESTADKVGPEPYVGGRNDRYGFGRLDAEQALLAVSACGFITVSPAVLPSGVVGALYGQSLVASGGAPAYGSAVTLGSLPPGLTLSTGGLLAGTPTTPGSYSFSVTATDADGCSGYRGYTVVIVPSFSVNDVSVTEGQSGTTTATFTVRLSSACEMPVSVDYATANGTASAGSDYVAASGTLSFPPGSTARSIAVTVNGDTASEPSETFFVNLSWARSEAIAAIADAQGVGTIVDDEMPSLAVNDVTVTEGHSGTTSATFTVSLSVASGQTVTVSYATSNGTASSDSDYAAASGTLSFPPGSTAQTIAIGVNGDTATEPGETFFVNLSGATNAPIADPQGVGTIVNDDVPSLSISDVTVTERNGGTTGGTFTVSLSAASGQAVTVRYATADGTASAASDYMAVSGTLTFPPGWTTASLVVPARGDTWLEPDETFLVNLSGAVNATITDAQGVGTIVDDDLPSLFIGELSVTEGHSGTRSATFNVSLIPASEQTVTVDYATENGTASAGSDYVAASGTLSFPPGSTWQSLVVTVTGDTVFEPDETFYVSLSGATNATIEAAKGVGTIVNDDPSVSVDDVTVTEGHSGTTNATFTVRLSLASSQTVSVGIGTANGSASAGSDYVTASRTLSFSPGSTARGFTVVVNGDTAFEANETFFVNLSGATNATIVDGQGQGTILNDDSPPPPPAGPPFGSFDTPASGSTGVTGAIAVTGWALDNTGVTKVQVYRDPMPGEPTRPNGKVYIGDGTFVPGARPDIAAAFPAYPNADRAGWGYMLLTNMLPGQGNGPFVLYAYAYDGSGNTTLLGGKAITCSNATATKPFGTLDTPGQGQTVSGNAYSVFGWALTPQPGVIPTDGSTIQVYVDGVPRGHPTYDLYRADIATLFPGYANTNGAVGYFVLDTTALSNGIHSIAWSVTDNLGRTDGIGSRFFWVQN